ncbi:MAG: hypothetical protein M3O35_12445 [Acidobacteriota bacterium]|nr:hypothetical protein [Acidobacteriota bacterium]
MDPTLRALLSITMRWVHITSVATLIGSFICARYVVAPGIAATPELGAEMARRFRGLLYTVMSAALASGLYNYLSKPVYPPHYHMWIGIKFLFVLHIFAVSILYPMQGATEAKRRRWLTGMIVTGLIVIGISAWLRWISIQ